MTHFLLAGGHENRQKTPATAMSGSQKFMLVTVPLIAELETLVIAGRGWSRQFEERVDAVSVALFGITRADTNPPPPHADLFYAPGARSPDYAAYRRACEEHDALLESLWVPTPNDMSDEELISWWWQQNVYVGGKEGAPLRCLINIDRQFHAAAKELLPGAKLTFDGTGKRAAVSAEAWGDNMAANAAQFVRNKRR